MLNMILPFIPTVLKAVIGTKDAPELEDAIGMPKLSLKGNKKALIATSIALLAYYGVTLPPEWVTFLYAVLPVVAAVWAAFFVVSKPKVVK